MSDFRAYKTIKPEELEERALCWRTILGLSDWHIVVSIEREFDMPEKESAGVCQYRTILRHASIALLDPVDWKSDDFEYDMEKTLVHELLHCSFALVDSDDDVRDRAQHRLLEEMACALVCAYRSERANA